MSNLQTLKDLGFEVVNSIPVLDWTRYNLRFVTLSRQEIEKIVDSLDLMVNHEDNSVVGFNPPLKGTITVPAGKLFRTWALNIEVVE
jgi:hypothetical protein